MIITPELSETPQWTGSYVSPGAGAVYDVAITPSEQAGWMDYIPTLIAVIRSGAVDELIYEIAKACHERHVATAGRATSARPSRDTRIKSVEPASVEPYLILCADNPLVADRGAAPYFTAMGERFSKNRAIGYYFTMPDTTAVNLRGAFVQIEDCTPAYFAVRVVGNADPDVLGRLVKVRYSNVPALFRTV
jgi:hypothetical protein